MKFAVLNTIRKIQNFYINHKLASLVLVFTFVLILASSSLALLNRYSNNYEKIDNSNDTSSLDNVKPNLDNEQPLSSEDSTDIKSTNPPSSDSSTGPKQESAPSQPRPNEPTTPPQTINYTIPSNSIIVNSTSTFKAAVSSASAGSTIVLRAGIYTDISLTISKRLTIAAYPGESVWLDGQNKLQFALFLVTNAGGSKIQGIGFKKYASTKDFSLKPAMVIIASSLSSGVTVEYCTFQESESIGLSVQTNNSVVKNNVFDKNNWMGLHVNNGHGIIVQNNIMSNNNTGNNAISGTTAAAAGAKFTYTRGATITNNQFINNKANGLWIDLQAADIVISNNTASGNLRNGIYYEVSTRGTITNNTVTGNSAYGIQLSGSNNTTVTGNSLSGNSLNIFVQEDPRNVSNDSKCSSGAAFGADCDSYNNTVQSSP
jgi:parallel beta-helix repeat protein